MGKPIHKGDLEYQELGLNDKDTVKKILEFVAEYLSKHGPDKDFNGEKISR